MSKKIRLYKSGNCWMSENLVNGKPDPEFMKWFQTHLIPTAFTEKASAESVLQAISKLNPNAIVELK